MEQGCCAWARLKIINKSISIQINYSKINKFRRYFHMEVGEETKEAKGKATGFNDDGWPKQQQQLRIINPILELSISTVPAGA